MDFEERRARGLTPADYIDEHKVPHDPWTMQFGMHTDALIHYFKKGISPPTLGGTSFKAGDDQLFKLYLFSVLLLDMNEFARDVDIDAVYTLIRPQIEWTPPCGQTMGCAGLCRALCCRLSLLMHAVKAVRAMSTDAHLDAHERKREAELAAIATNNIYAHIDSHMPLIMAVEYYHSAHDNVRTEGRCIEALWTEALARARPNLQYAYTEYTVPDLSVLMPMSVMYNHEDVSNKRMTRRKFPDMNEHNVTVLMTIVNLLYKTVPHRCYNRESHKSIKNACNNNHSMVELVCKLVIASWLGVYRTSATKMPLDVRVLVYKFFYRGVPFGEIMATFDQQNTTALMYMAKEYYSNIASGMPGFVSAMRIYYNWDMYTLYVARVSEIVRRKLIENIRASLAPSGAGISALNDIFRGIDASIISMHEEYRQYQRTNSINYNLRDILKKCTNFNYNRYDYAKYENTVKPGEEYLLPDPNEMIDKDKLEIMRKMVSLFPRNAMVPMDILVFFGVPVQTIAEMKSIVFGRMPDLQRLFMSLPREIYVIFFSFFRLSLDRDIYAEFPADAAMYYHHCHALINKYKISDHEQRPRVAGILQACDNCGDTKHASFYRRYVKNKHSDGKGDILMTGDGTSMCACFPQRPEWRDLYFAENNEHAPSLKHKKPVRWTPKTVNRKKTKSAAIKIMRNRCFRTKTRELCALGRICIYDNVTYVACMDDLRVAPLEHMRYLGEKIICRECYDARMTEAEEAAASSATAQTLCEYCEVTTNEDARVSFFLHDDREDRPKDAPPLRTMYFCRSHGSLSWARSHGYTRRSQVMRGIIERWDTTTADGKYIPCEPPRHFKYK